MVASALEPGCRVDNRFRIERLLGRGGYGEVYLAHQLSMQRSVALKTLHTAASADATTLERFQNEARWACQLNHPNTVTYYDFGYDAERDLAYLVMEYLHGETLAERLKRCGPLSFDELTVILEQICGSLAEAHSLGIVHRDVKPENIMLIERAGRSNYVKVIDFGIAKILEPLLDGVQDRELTATGAMIGSPHYMSPEQIRAGAAPVDRRADLYALGCLVFKALTGVPPFRGRSAMDIATRHLIDPAPPLSAIANGRTFPPALEALIARTLSKDPEQRPTTTLVFFEDYLAAVQGSLVTPHHLLQQGATPAPQARRSERPTVIDTPNPLRAAGPPPHVSVHLPAPPPAAGRAASRVEERHIHTLNAPAPPLAAQRSSRRPLLLLVAGLAMVCAVGIGVLITRMAQEMSEPASEASPRPGTSAARAAPSPEAPAVAAQAQQQPPVEEAPKESPPDEDLPTSAASPTSAPPSPALGARRRAPAASVASRGATPREDAATAPPTTAAPQPAAPLPRLLRVTFVARPWGKLSLGGRSADGRLEMDLKPGAHTVTVEQFGRVVLRQTLQIKPEQTHFILQVPPSGAP